MNVELTMKKGANYLDIEREVGEILYQAELAGQKPLQATGEIIIKIRWEQDENKIRN